MKKAPGRLVALLIGVAVAAAGTVAAATLMPIPIWALLREALDSPSAEAPWSQPFGFRAYYVAPPTREVEKNADGTTPSSLHCGMGLGGPASFPWDRGPHGDFGNLGPNLLARESLEWFHDSTVSEAWRENPTARLGLEYATQSGTVIAHHVEGLDLPWDEQLQTWFQHFSPTDSSASVSMVEGYDWTIEFGDRGVVRGESPSTEAAIDAMSAHVREADSSRLLLPSSFSLGWQKRRSDFSSDYTAVSVHDAEDLDDLPNRLRERIEEIVSFRSDIDD